MKLKKLKRQVAYAAVAGALAGVGMVGSAQAVNLNPDGLGEVLIFPYYTVRNNQVTVFSVVNTTAASKALKVRFLEGKNSREVLDFNLYLSPNDVWAASVTATGDGAQVNVVDMSCTTPVIATALGGPGSVEFRNSLYLADVTSDHGNDRTREGYIEVIEMGTVVNAFDIGGGTTFASAITHVGGVLTAAKCQGLTTSWAPGGVLNGSAAGSVTANSGGIFGTAHIIGLSEGTDISYEPTVLNGFNTTAGGSHTSPGDLTPSLSSVFPKNSIVFRSDGTVAASSWALTTATSPVDPVSAVIMQNAIDNEYVTATDLLAGTDWVVTFPTKRFHLGGLLRPFTGPFTATGSCDLVTPTIFGREEEMKTGSIDFSPSPTPGTTQLCWETNVIRFGTNASADVLKSAGVSMAIPSSQIFTNGWMRLRFNPTVLVARLGGLTPDVNGNGIDDNFDVMATQVHQMSDTGASSAVVGAGGFTYQGLPTIGFAAIRYAAGTSSALAGYGASYSHKGERLITARP